MNPFLVSSYQSFFYLFVLCELFFNQEELIQGKLLKEKRLTAWILSKHRVVFFTLNVTVPYYLKLLTAACILSAIGPLYNASAPLNAICCSVSARAVLFILSPC